MSKWLELDLARLVTEILLAAEYVEANHHLGRPFQTAYQLAIALESQYPDVCRQLALPVGGTDSGAEASLAQYLAREISRNIENESLVDVEGGFLCNDYLLSLKFKHAGNVVESSMTNQGKRGVSLFRIRAR
jgi:hypothetical protein